MSDAADYLYLFEYFEQLEFLYDNNTLIFGDFNITNYANYLEHFTTDSKCLYLSQFIEFFKYQQFNLVKNADQRILDLVISDLECIVVRDMNPLIREDSHHPSLYVTVSVAGLVKTTVDFNVFEKSTTLGKLILFNYIIPF